MPPEEDGQDERDEDPRGSAVQVHSRRLAPGICTTKSSSEFVPERGFVGMEGRGLADVYELQEQLGDGAFSTVYLATETRLGEPRAVKLLYPDSSEDSSANADIEEAFRLEMQVLLAVDHPNLVRGFDFFESPSCFALAMEFCPHGSLMNFLAKDERPPEEAAADTARQLCRGLAYLHGLGVCHRDVKPENVLVAGVPAPGCPLLKLADFGSAAFRPYVGGTPGMSSYAAPEVSADAPLDESCDMWSTGMIVFVVLSRVDATTVRRCAEQGSLPQIDSATATAAGWLAWCLDADPSARCPAAAALAHDWLTPAREPPMPPPRALERLASAPRLSRLQRTAARFAAYSAPVEELTEALVAFHALDADQDGTISLQELSEGLVHAELGDGREALEALASSRTDAISFSEFAAACLGQECLTQSHVLRRTFWALDPAGTGHLAQQGLREVFAQAVGQEWVVDIFAQMIENQSEGLTLEVLREALKNDFHSHEDARTH